MPAIEADNLSCRYSNGRGVHELGLSVQTGECFALLGRNGSGKTTLNHLLLGLLRPSAGRLTVLGCDLSRGGREHLSRCAAALDTPVLWDRLTARQNAFFVGRSRGMRGADLHRRIEGLLETAGLAEHADEPIGVWSLGMRRKLCVVQALLDDAELAILDEPTAAVDPQFQAVLADLLRDRRRRGRTTWITSNDPEFAAAVADRAAFMDEGRILVEADVADLLAELSPTCQVAVRLAFAHPVPPPDDEAVTAFGQSGDCIDALVAADAQAVGRLVEHIALCGGQVASLEVRRPTLRDAFLARTRHAASVAPAPESIVLSSDPLDEVASPEAGP